MPQTNCNSAQCGCGSKKCTKKETEKRKKISGGQADRAPPEAKRNDYLMACRAADRSPEIGRLVSHCSPIVAHSSSMTAAVAARGGDVVERRQGGRFTKSTVHVTKIATRFSGCWEPFSAPSVLHTPRIFGKRTVRLAALQPSPRIVPSPKPQKRSRFISQAKPGFAPGSA